MKLSKQAARFIETELVIILAIVLLLGILFGYSLALNRFSSSTGKGKTPVNNNTSLLRSGSSSGGTSIE